MDYMLQRGKTKKMIDPFTEKPNKLMVRFKGKITI
jgi:hypothetical protein